LLAITNHLAAVEAGFLSRKEDGSFVMPEGSQRAVEEAQRLVIRELAARVNPGSMFDGYHYSPPTEDCDRKLWYLELLESQVNTSEEVM
jgi:hypothetical protein